MPCGNEVNRKLVGGPNPCCLLVVLTQHAISFALCDFLLWSLIFIIIMVECLFSIKDLCSDIGYIEYNS